ncbi:hypothetical protein [Oribacterium sp. Sow4_G1_1]|uniref:hypothetical protein n=1 Tax=Oribacterium sp. Sow4_G1_1 TaxID=3438794 RepID=UPI003F9AFF81
MAESEEIVVRCRCGQRLFDFDPMTKGIITTKCPRCKAVMAVSIMNRKIKCTEQIAAHAG